MSMEVNFNDVPEPVSMVLIIDPSEHLSGMEIGPLYDVVNADIIPLLHSIYSILHYETIRNRRNDRILL